MLQIPVGAQLTFIRDDSVVCEEVAARCSLTGDCAWSAKPAGKNRQSLKVVEFDHFTISH